MSTGNYNEMQYRLKRIPKTKLRLNLQRLMLKHDVKSGSDLARQLDIPPPTINRILSGQVNDPRCSTLMLLAEYFEVTIDQLLGKENLF